MNVHLTVMRNEVLDALQPRDGGRYLDVTAGGGGHSEGLLERSGPSGRLLATDADSIAVSMVADRLQPFGPRATVRQSWMHDAISMARDCGMLPLDGIVADLGFSSNQMDNEARGFSFMREGPLDMRFDQTRGVSAAELVNGSDVRELTTILRLYGEVDHARRVAEAIWAARPLKTTADLRDAVTSVAPRSGKIHPATQVFQAFRIAVNDELKRLSDTLPVLVDALVGGGRLAVISFHSLEDRTVKVAFRNASAEVTAQPGFGDQTTRKPTVTLVTRKPIYPGEQEVHANPRARSAVLRVVEKLL